jgi:hypothetical protein
MSMTFSVCADCESSLAYGFYAAIVFFAPIGAFVMRKHIASAVGAWKIAGRALQLLAVLSLPFAAMIILTVIAAPF